MEELRRILKSVFASWDGRGFSPEMRLGEIPEFDSMTAVNLLVEAEAAFGVSLDEVTLTPRWTIQQFWDTIEDRRRRSRGRLGS